MKKNQHKQNRFFLCLPCFSTGRRKKILAAFPLFMLFAALSVNAKPTQMDILVKAFANLKSWQAGFVQTIYDVKRVPLQKSKGVVYIKKPGKFRWDYKKPFSQLIVSNNKELWIYDAEMQQATVKPVDQALASAPAMLLGSDTPIYQAFDLRDLGKREGLAWVELIPKEKDTDFKKIIVGMKGDNVQVMELRDNFSQVTQIQFHHIKKNPKLNDALFDFEPPKGVDVLGR